jgi:hypothetical protein
MAWQNRQMYGLRLQILVLHLNCGQSEPNGMSHLMVSRFKETKEAAECSAALEQLF